MNEIVARQAVSKTTDRASAPSRRLAAAPPRADKGSPLVETAYMTHQVWTVYLGRLQRAHGQYLEGLKASWKENPFLDNASEARSIKDPATSTMDYAVDTVQRMVLLADTIRQRGNNYLAHVAAGQPPLLHFATETVLDARQFERPVNYALLRILPPEGVNIDPRTRPYLIIDPRAGHGPGIGGFKADSEVGVALRRGHPVYFVAFFRDPEPGQTLLDVCETEKQFVRKVREFHPDSPKPAIIGNCQAGWAAMMLAASDPVDTGPLVIIGAPMSYWSGAWREGEGDNPMRYSGGNLGGTWLASLTADLGHGVFDGAYLVQNFENLNPAHNYWDKYYNLYSKVDTEAARFLEFDRWWGAFFLMNREEIEWITHNLFVGNTLWKGGSRAVRGKALDLREIRQPIVLFASLGDNITPPQQAFNWVADIYGSTEEIKARGQVIVGLVHEHAGHLGIFVSGEVNRKEHAQIVSALDSIEMLAPGLYGMEIHENGSENGEPRYEVQFREYRLEEVAGRLNRFQRIDEKPFEAVAAASDFNQRAYEVWLQPWVRACSTDQTAELLRQLHPLRLQRWAFSDANPALAALAPAAAWARAARKPVDASNPWRALERSGASAVSAWLDFGRALRDAASEVTFLLTYGGLVSLFVRPDDDAAEPAIAEPRNMPFVRQALASMEDGSYPEALARVAALLTPQKGPLDLAALNLGLRYSKQFVELVPDMPHEAWRRLQGEQDIIVRYEPEKALATLPKLVKTRRDHTRLSRVLREFTSEEALTQFKPTDEQRKMLLGIAQALDVSLEELAQRVTGALPLPSKAL